MTQPSKKKAKPNPNAWLNDDEMMSVFSFVQDAPSMLHLALANKSIHEQFDHWIGHLVNSDTLHSEMRGKGIDLRILFMIKDKLPMEWMRKYRQTHPLDLVIYYKAL